MSVVHQFSRPLIRLNSVETQHLQLNARRPQRTRQLIVNHLDRDAHANSTRWQPKQQPKRTEFVDISPYSTNYNSKLTPPIANDHNDNEDQAKTTTLKNNDGTNKRPTTNDQRPTTNDSKRRQRTNDNKRRTSNFKQQTNERTNERLID